MTNYEEVAVGIGRLVTKKNKAYGDRFNKTGDILEILYPNGIMLNDYDNVLAIVRILDKMFRIATDEAAMGEDPWNDIAGYVLLKVADSIPERSLRQTKTVENILENG